MLTTLAIARTFVSDKGHGKAKLNKDVFLAREIT
jgi:hypothetical protein